MNTNTIQTRNRRLLILSLFALAAAAAWAEPVNNGDKTVRLATGATRLTPAPLPTTVRPRPITPMPISFVADAAVPRGAENSGRMDVARKRGVVGVNAEAETNAAVRGRERGLAVESAARGAVIDLEETESTVQAIEAAPHSTRGTLSARLETKIDATARAMAELRAEARELKGEARGRFDQAYAELRAQERTLRATLKDAVRESKEATWGQVQSRLAQDYRAYVKAAAEAETAAEAGAPGAPKS